MVENRVEDFISLYLSRYYIEIKDSSLRPLKQALPLFKDYIRLIWRWNSKVNLVACDNVENLWKKHLIPSLKPLEYNLIPTNSLVLDAGSGAGLPGIPLKILRPDISIHLCEAKRKKALFLREAIEVLGLEKTIVIQDRVENLKTQYDIILSRAMGKPVTVVPLLRKLLNSYGKMLIWTAKETPQSFPDFKVASLEIEDGGKILVLS
jgi:16S rRNA (guanine527-N7)-methyltransferase